MSTVTITLSDERMRQLLQLAQDAQVPPEALLQARVEEWLSQPATDFLKAATYVLQKNQELYRRLA